MLLPKRVTTLLVDSAPPMMSLVKKIIPNRVEKKVVTYLINHLSKEFIEMGEVDFMEGKVVKISISDVGIEWFFTKENHLNSITSSLKILTETHINKITPDVVFSGTLNAMVLMASQKVDPDTLFFNRELTISGDTDLGLHIKNLIDQFDLELLQSPVKKTLTIWADHILEAQQLGKVSTSIA